MSTGVTPTGSGYSAEPEPISVVSAAPVSIPNAAGLRPLREFLDEFDARQRAELGWWRWATAKAWAVVTVRWRLRWHYFWHPKALKYVSPETFDIVAADAIAMEARRAETTKIGSVEDDSAGLKGIAQTMRGPSHD